MAFYSASILRAAGLAAAFFFVAGASASAAQVEVKGLHLCCGGCISAVEDALEGVKGVTKVSVDRGAGAASFVAADAKTTTAALVALHEAGFAGKPTVDGKAAEFPAPKIAAGTKAKSLVVEGVHLCCRSCTQGVVKALSKDKAIGQIQCDQNEGTVSLTGAGGAEIDVPAVLAALNGAGYSGVVRDPKETK